MAVLSNSNHERVSGEKAVTGRVAHGAACPRAMSCPGRHSVVPSRATRPPRWQGANHSSRRGWRRAHHCPCPRPDARPVTRA